MRMLIKVSVAAVFFFICCVLTQAQGGQKPATGGGTQGAGQGGAAASSVLQGLSWSQPSWNVDLTGFPHENFKKVAVACYALKYGNSASQPMILEPAVSDKQIAEFDQKCNKPDSGELAEKDPTIVHLCEKAKEKLKASDYSKVTWSPCSKLTSDHPLLMGQSIVVAIDPGVVSLDARVKILNINVTYTQGTPINPTPVRSSFSNAAASSMNLDTKHIYFLTWPNEVPGDTIAAVNVNAVYTPVIPGDKWISDTFYPAGSIVASPTETGHYYMATNGGVSGTPPPAFSAAPSAVSPDGSILWLDAGSSAPQAGGGNTGAATTNLWAPLTAYNRGQTILDPYNGHYYTVISVTTPMTCTGGGVAATPPPVE